MATHQSHNIPWQVLANAMEIQCKYMNVFGAPPRLVERIIHVREDSPINPDKNFKACKHFIRRFVATISEISASESKKFQEFNAQEDQFDDVLISGKYQQLSYWLNRETMNWSRDGDMVEIVRRLWERGFISSILCLVRNGLQMDELYERFHRDMINYVSIFYNDVRGIMEDCLVIYVMLNLGLAMGWLNDDPQHWPTRMKWICKEASGGRSRFLTAMFFDQTNSATFWVELKAYLGMLFRILYQLDIVWKELGKPVYWPGEIMGALAILELGAEFRYKNRRPSWH